MCIRHRWRVKEKKEWLKDQPEIITAYKIEKVKYDYKDCETGKGRLFPPCMFGNISGKQYKRKNRVRKAEHRKCWTYYDETCKATTYYAYFHLFAEEKAAKKWIGKPMSSLYKLIKCEVPKHLITDIGLQEQQQYLTIVTKGFDIIGEDEYLD